MSSPHAARPHSTRKLPEEVPQPKWIVQSLQDARAVKLFRDDSEIIVLAGVLRNATRSYAVYLEHDSFRPNTSIEAQRSALFFADVNVTDNAVSLKFVPAGTTAMTKRELLRLGYREPERVFPTQTDPLNLVMTQGPHDSSKWLVTFGGITLRAELVEVSDYRAVTNQAEIVDAAIRGQSDGHATLLLPRFTIDGVYVEATPDPRKLSSGSIADLTLPAA